MRKYSWARNGMRQDQDEGAYVHEHDAEEIQSDLMTVLRSIANRSYSDESADIIDEARAAIARVEGRNARIIAAAPDLLADLRALSHLCEVMNSRQHAGLVNGPAQWSMLYDLTNKAKATISAATGN